MARSQHLRKNVSNCLYCYSLCHKIFAAERKLEELVEKYEELKKSNKLQKHMERRSKKLARKEFKKLPNEAVK